MGDMGDLFRFMADARRERRAKFGVDCPTCTVKFPKANPSILLPQQRCKVCGYRDPRPRLTEEQAYSGASEDGEGSTSDPKPRKRNP